MQILLPVSVINETAESLARIGGGLKTGVLNPEVFVVSCLWYVGLIK